ncbi:MAG TPA: hypothetical protein VEC11_07655 [Allosphingosinicella sp.]|nr:hypothetical protein [Allosphingosinicella sp.]
MAARIHILAIESADALDIQAMKKPGKPAKAAMEVMTFDAFAAIDGKAFGQLCRDLAHKIGRPDLAAQVRR